MEGRSRRLVSAASSAAPSPCSGGTPGSLGTAWGWVRFGFSCLTHVWAQQMAGTSWSLENSDLETFRSCGPQARSERPEPRGLAWKKVITT